MKSSNIAMKIIIPFEGNKIEVLDAEDKPLAKYPSPEATKIMKDKTVTDGTGMFVLETNSTKCKWVWCDGWYYKCK